MSYTFKFAGKILLITLLGILLYVPFAMAGVMQIESSEKPTYIEMVPGESKGILLDHNLKRIVVGDPNIVDVKVLNRNRISITGKGLGNSSLNLTGETPNILTKVYVHVAPDLISLKQRINQLFPGQDIKIFPNNNGIILDGTVTGAEIIEQVLRLTQQMLAVPEKETPQPKVKINQEVVKEASQEELVQIIADTKQATINAKGESGSSQTGKSGLSIVNLM